MTSTLPATAPVEMIMPHAAQLWMNYLNWGLVALMLFFVLRHARTNQSIVGVMLLLGGALTTFNEPIVDILGKCWFPAIGSWVLFKAWGVSIPIHMLPVYIWFVGGQAFVCYCLYKRGITTLGVFGLYATFAAVNFCLEVPGLYAAEPMYAYFGNQPIVIFKFPLWWAICNPLMPMMMGAMAICLEPILLGARRLLIIPLSWMTALAVNVVAAPVWLALNTGVTVETADFCALISLGLGLMVCRGLSMLVASDAPPLRIQRAVLA